MAIVEECNATADIDDLYENAGVASKEMTIVDKTWKQTFTGPDRTAFVYSSKPSRKGGTVIEVQICPDSEVDENPEVTPKSLFLEAAYRFSESGQVRLGVDWIIDHVDDLLHAGNFSECDSLFRVVDPDKLANPLIVTFLGITLSAPRSKIPARSSFFARALATVTARRGEESAAKLLDKYR